MDHEKNGIKIYGISEIMSAITDHLDTNYKSVHVRGELSDMRSSQAGHYYMSLKDEIGSVLNAVMFRGYVDTEINVKRGDNVIVMGDISIYKNTGNLQIMVKRIFQLNELGKWQKLFEQIKKELSEKGYFDIERKRPLPLLIKSVGIVTSPSGAAIKDIISVLKRRSSEIDITIYPSAVQGEKAAAEIIEGIKFFNEIYEDKIDAIMITRGGGSIEDLWCFNDKDLANAIFNSKIPVISAVGHERDFTISDHVADIRAATPTAAGEMITKDIAGEYENTVKNLEYRFRVTGKKIAEMIDRTQNIENYVKWYGGLITVKSKELRSTVNDISVNINERLQDIRLTISESERNIGTLFSPKRIDLYKERLNALKKQLFLDIDGFIDKGQRAVKDVTFAMPHPVEKNIQIKIKVLERMEKQLSALSPYSILERGYSIIYKGDKVIRKYNEVEENDVLRARLYLGELEMEVKNAKEK